MERDSIVYKMRRKLQVLAHLVVSDEIMSKVYYRILLKKKLQLDNPKTFNEKLQWLKLYYYPKTQVVIEGTDKYLVRKYVKEKGLENILDELLGVWDNPEDINWDKLPNKFVLKCNHGCAYNILCADKEKFNKINAIKQLKSWLKEDFGAFNVEIHYSQIKNHKVICEEYLGDCITDYKFFCFNGKPKFLYVSEDLVHDRQAKIGYFYLDGTKIPMKREEYDDIEEANFPAFFDEMVENAKILAQDFPFVRVDYFLANNRYYFAELTFTPGGCMNVFDPPKYDEEWGALLDISSLVKK